MERGPAAPGRIEYFDALRVFASFAVMALHLAAQHWADVGVDSPAWRVLSGWNSAVRWCVPVFAMISGALFLERPVSPKKLYGGHVARMAAAFAFWSLIYALIGARRYGFSLSRFGSELLIGHYHLWFLYMIAGLYLLVPLLYRIVQSERLGRYFLLLAFVFAFVLPELVSLLALYLPGLANAVSTALAFADLRPVMGYSGYFVLGCYLNRRTLNRGEELAIYALGLLGFAATIFGTWAVSLRTGAPSTLLYGNCSCTVNVLFESAAVFTLFKQRVRHVSIWLRALSGASFGAYLIHALILDTLQFRFDVDTLSFTPYLSVPLLALAVFLMSYAASLLLRKIPLVRNWIL